jgi:GntP family gluconate:H+ symporter
MHLFAQIDSATGSYWPFGILAISVLFIVIAITVLRLHAFLALVLAALLAGWLSKAGSMPDSEGLSHGVAVLETAAAAFGRTAGGIGIVIALASIIGMALMESGAADKIVRCFMRFFGEKRGGVALLVSGFILSIPVFFDTVFFLLVPLARALAARTGKNFMFFVLAIGGGGALTHSIVPPTPGPLLVADAMNLDLGIVIVAGLGAGLLPAWGIYYVAKWLGERVPVPLREVAGATREDLNKILQKKDHELPPFWISILPVVLPVFFIAAASFLGVAGTKMPGVVEALGGPDRFASLQTFFDFIGNKTFALLLGAVIALGIYFVQEKLSFREMGEKLGPPLETAGLIILITSAGGAFGAMIRYAGVGDAIEAVAEGRGINYVLLAWCITAVVRVAQGSATVSMITGSALMTAIIAGKDLPYHPVYIYLAIGFGSIILSWMNDSGFWVVGKLSGFTEKETLKSWSVMTTALSIMGLVEIMILIKIPFLAFAP